MFFIPDRWATALAILFFSTLSFAQAPPDADQLLLQKMTLEQKVGQLFILGFMGTDTDHSLNDVITRLHPGGVLVFSRNIRTAKQTAQLLYHAQAASIKSTRAPLLIAVDQEGGDVIRIKTSPQLPSAMGLAQAGDKTLVREAGLQTANILKALGFNMNLAPVLDIADSAKDSFIGTRAFGKTPELVSEMGLAFADGLRAGGILPTAKHFPGHGGVRGDSHLVTPQKNISLERLLETDLVPYAELTKRGGASAVMVAHIAFPKIDPSLAPATYSKTLISDVLRGKIGFQGIVMTDDIEMGGAGSGGALDHAKRAINAGVDLVMMAWNKKMQFKVIRGVLAAVKSKELSITRIDESVLRILRIKRQFASFDAPVLPDAKLLLASVRGPGIQAVSKKVLDNIFKSLHTKPSQGGAGHSSRLDIESLSAKKFLVYSLNESFYRSFRSSEHKLNSRFEGLTPDSPERIDLALNKSDSTIALIYISGPRSAKAANTLTDESARRTILVNADSQSLVKDANRFADVIDVSFKHLDTGAMVAAYLESLSHSLRAPSSRESPRE